MKDYIALGPVPCDEECQQVGTQNYDANAAYKESNRFANLLRSKFGNEPEGARITVKSFPHDFGSYYEVVCFYDDSFPESVDYAFKLEAESPTNWEE